MDNDSNTELDNSYSEYENEYDLCCDHETGSRGLPFDPTSLENIILSICDQFDFRILLNDGRAKNALLVTTGLTLAGSLIGKHYGGKFGATVGGVVGGACGIKIVVVSMRDIWQEIKGKMCKLLDVVYNYLAGLGVDDYKMVVAFLMQHSGDKTQLAMLILQVTSDILGKKILSTLNTV